MQSFISELLFGRRVWRRVSICFWIYNLRLFARFCVCHTACHSNVSCDFSDLLAFLASAAMPCVLGDGAGSSPFPMRNENAALKPQGRVMCGWACEPAETQLTFGNSKSNNAQRQQYNQHKMHNEKTKGLKEQSGLPKACMHIYWYSLFAWVARCVSKKDWHVVVAPLAQLGVICKQVNVRLQNHDWLQISPAIWLWVLSLVVTLPCGLIYEHISPYIYIYIHTYIIMKERAFR